MTKFQHFVRMVRNLKPGERISIDDQELCDARPRSEYNGAVFEAADWVLENIVGAAWEFSWRHDPIHRTFGFYRLLKPLPTDGFERTYVSPDRRDCREPRNAEEIVEGL